MVDSPALNAAREKLKDALQALVEEIGPRCCEHGDWADCMECSFDATAPLGGGAMLSEFAVVMAWTGMEDGENYVGVHTAPKQLLSHTNGLLFTALYE